jgi:multisubunit Na+/H+ antiporter MnhF subunit
VIPSILILADAAGPAAMPWYAQLAQWTLTLGLVIVFGGMGCCLYRLVRGPHVADRAMAVDTLGIHLIALVVLLSLKWNTLMFFDGILVLSLVGFAGAVAMAQYIGRPHLARTQSAESKQENA